ncbi:MAG: hypothetical protein ACP5IT_10550 [Thermoproteota archaeon]
MVLIGDEGVDVRVVYIKKETKPTVEPMAKELFDFNIERINTIVNGCTLGDFLFESTCVQLDIVLLVSALETYLKKRFVELEHEGWDANFNALVIRSSYPSIGKDERKK